MGRERDRERDSDRERGRERGRDMILSVPFTYNFKSSAWAQYSTLLLRFTASASLL